MTKVLPLTTPLGVLELRYDPRRDCLAEIRLPRRKRRQARTSRPAAPAWVEALAQALDAYFRGEPVALGSDHLDWDRFTPFQRRVYECLLAVGRGETQTYAQLAAAAGSPGAARAVGNAMANNPYPLIVPCHRVVAANGLGGFGGGLPMKRYLLQLEQEVR